MIQSLSYSSTIEELLLADISLVVGGTVHLSTLSKSLAKLFQLTVSLKKVGKEWIDSAVFIFVVCYFKT